MAEFLALICSTCLGIADFNSGLASRRAPAMVVALIGQSIALLAAIVGVIAWPAIYSTQALLWGSLAGLFTVIGMMVFYTALGRSLMAVVSTITATMAAAVPVGVGVVINAEQPSLLTGLGIALALLAITLIVWRNNDNSGQRSFAPTSWKLAIGMGVVGGCAFGLGLVFYSRSPHNSGLWTMLGERSCSFLLLLLLVNYRFGRGGAGAGHLLLRCWTWMTAHHFVMAVAGVSGLFQGVASMAYLNAVRNGPLSVIAVLSTLYPAVTTFLASLFLGERLRRNQLAGLILALVAIGTLSYALKQSG